MKAYESLFTTIVPKGQALLKPLFLVGEPTWQQLPPLAHLQAQTFGMKVNSRQCQ